MRDILRTKDNQLPWVKYVIERVWFDIPVYEKEYLRIIRVQDGVLYIDPKQYGRVSKYLRWDIVYGGKVCPYGWYVR